MGLHLVHKRGLQGLRFSFLLQLLRAYIWFVNVAHKGLCLASYHGSLGHESSLLNAAHKGLCLASYHGS